MNVSFFVPISAEELHKGKKITRWLKSYFSKDTSRLSVDSSANFEVGFFKCALEFVLVTSIISFTVLYWDCVVNKEH